VRNLRRVGRCELGRDQHHWPDRSILFHRDRCSISRKLVVAADRTCMRGVAASADMLPWFQTRSKLVTDWSPTNPTCPAPQRPARGMITRVLAVLARPGAAQARPGAAQASPGRLS